MRTLFDTTLPERAWSLIPTEGFDAPVPGALFRASRKPCCGVPLGGVGTGCVDIDAAGAWGYNSMFNGYTFNPDSMRIPRVAPTLWPMLGLAVDGQVWVLAAQEIVDGGLVSCCTEPFILNAKDKAREPHRVLCQDIKGVKAARDIAYFGHFPIADMEFETDAPISVGLRAWAPFIPGDALASNLPAAVFEVHLRNGGDKVRAGSIVLNFAGPSAAEARSSQFLRTPVNEEVQGLLVSALGSDTSYCIGALGEKVRTGAGLNRHPRHWAGVATTLPSPEAVDRDGGGVVSLNADASVAVDFELPAGGERVVRFVLAWYSPFILGAQKAAAQLDRLKNAPGADVNSYTSMYALRFRSALEVARRMAADHEGLLSRVLAWQKALYAEERLPAWMRDQLLSTLALMTEDSYWVQPRPPIGDWAFPGGVFGLNESSRGCPHLECIPCSFYGNMPVVYFFPELAVSTLRAFKEYQRDDGNIAFELGACWSLPDFATPTYDWQQALNGSCYIALADRIWLRTGDDAFLREFYESLKACNSYVMGLNTGYGGPVSMPTKGPKSEWFEFGEWDGICAHMGGIRLAQLQIMRRMAERMGDAAYAEQCKAWLDQGSSAVETELWNGSYYLNFVVKETGRVSDEVMAYQNVGQWMSAYHGFGGVFDHARVKTALETVKRINIPLTPAAGAANFARPDAKPLDAENKIGFYGSTALFVAEAMMLGMVFMIEGQRDYGMEFLRKLQHNNALVQGHQWDLPCIMRGDTGERNTGTDYYQNMMFWAVPATVLGTDLRGLCAPGGWIDAIMKAGADRRGARANTSTSPAFSVPLVDTADVK
jgi:uncharacterized protein (DUF608 family)